MIEIIVPERADSVSRISLEDNEYKLRFTYNESGNFWSLGIKNANDDILVSSIRIVPNFPLNVFLGTKDAPKGIFVCICNNGDIDKYAFVDGRAHMCYMESGEVKSVLERNKK